MDNTAPLSPSPAKLRRKLSGIETLGLVFLISVFILAIYLKCTAGPNSEKSEADKDTSLSTYQDAKQIQHEERFSVVRGTQGAEIGGVFIADLREMLYALYEGGIYRDQAKLCVFTFEAQCGARVESIVNEYAICAVTGGQMQPFAIEIDGSESELLSGQAIRYLGHQSFTTQNGTVRMIPVFKSEPNVKSEEDYDHSQYKAIKPN